MVVTYQLRAGEQLTQRAAKEGQAPYVPRMGETVRIKVPGVGHTYQAYTVFEVITTPNDFEDYILVILDPQVEPTA
jgi:hypothetical protein